MKNQTASVQPLAEEVYLRLKEEIVSHTRPPGTPLREVELAREFQISRTPVRQALQRLETEGLVSIEPARGARISEVSLQEALEIYEIRELLEPHAAYLAAKRRTPADISRLRDMHLRLEESSEVLDVDRRQALDAELHTLIANICRNRTLVVIVEQLRLRSQHAFGYIAKEYYGSGLEEHLRLIDAIIEGKPEQAHEAMAQHLRSARAHLVLP